MVLIFVLQIVFSVFFLFLFVSIVWWINAWRYSRGLKDVKGPKPFPIIGNVTELDTTTLFWQINEWHKEYGYLAKAFIGFDFVVSLADPEYLEFVCTNPLTSHKGYYYRYLHNWLNLGLLTSADQKWHKRRKLITPAYHFKILEQFVPVFDKTGNILMDKLRENVGKLSFNVQDLISLCTLDIINETAMGISVNAQLNANTDYVNAIKVLTHIVTERGIKIHKHFDLLYFFTKDYRIEKKCLKIVHNYSLSVIESRRKELQKNSESNSFNPNFIDEFGRRKRIAFLDLLLQSTIDGQPLTDEDIREEVDTFMFEGHDTTASGISFWLHLISKHPEIQEKLILEQQNIFGDDPFRPTTLSDLQNMNYMEMTIKETLRLYPSVPMMLRDCIKDIKFRDMTFKKGTQLLIFPFYLHRRPDIFPEPEKFIPERFQAENINKRHAFSYLAFSAGSRNCIGQKFAMLEMKCILGKILRNFEIHQSYPAHEVKIQADIIIASKNGYRIQLKHRKW